MKPRVPVALQQIFLQSNGGGDVQKISPPKNGLGFTIFQRKDRKFTLKPNIKNNDKKNMKAPRRRSMDHSVGSMRSVRSGESASESFRKHNPITQDKRKERKPIDTPQGYLDAALQERGYSTEKYVSTDGGYYCRPTPLQKASYGIRMNEAVLNSDANLLRRLLDVGLSPNPCNDFGESLVHRICRRGDHKLLRVLLEKGCCLQIADDYGRTPLHDAFWKAEPSEEVLQLILKADKDLIRMMDCRGFVPLDYVRKESHSEMIQFLETRVLDKFFPTLDPPSDQPPLLTQKKPHSSPVPDPQMALVPHTAALVANGEIEPEDALHWDDSSYESSDWESDEESLQSEGMNEDLDVDFDEAEILELCMRVGGPLAVSKHCLAKKSPITSRSFVRDMPLNLSSSHLSITSEDLPDDEE